MVVTLPTAEGEVQINSEVVKAVSEIEGGSYIHLTNGHTIPTFLLLAGAKSLFPKAEVK